jgi:WD40 repeat protein
MSKLTISAATDWCFSTSWSKDGRKFAVASQDGQVTIWDHRSSRPLAIFYSRPSKDTHQDDGGLASHHLHQDEVTSSSGREAARVVKFSPEGSSRDLLVFSEENTNIHIIDARTFDTHVVIPVPKEVPGVPPSARHTGIDSVHYGISGIAFDPSGDWLYAGTERTVVEWDLRRCGGGEGGTWSMA